MMALFTALTIGALAGVVRGAVPAPLEAPFALVLGAMLILGWTGRLRAAGVFGALALPLLGALAHAVLDLGAARGGAAPAPAEALLHLYTVAVTFLALGYLVVGVLHDTRLPVAVLPAAVLRRRPGAAGDRRASA
jgi:hypothetical protein